jgi:salicylate biosynthesis isochorismate synthase/menaquinone-specific isochorismate synthase
LASGRAAGPSVPVPAVSASAEAELRERACVAGERAERFGRPTLASLTVPGDPGLDVTACMFASRRADERYFAWEQPDRDGFALAGLGAALTVEGVAGPERFAAAGRRCAEALRDMVGEVGGTQPAAGPVWSGGFAFSSEGGTEAQWATLPPALLVLPELSLVRQGEQASATVNVVCRPGEDAVAGAERALARLAGLRVEPMPLRDPDPAGGFDLVSSLPPDHYVKAVAKARELIRAGELEKVVLAREVRVEGRTPFHPAPVFDNLRAAYPSCFCFCVGTPEVAFVGASPELLVRREGAGVATVAMAGSTRRSADPAVDDHLGQRLLQDPKERTEHAIVASRIERELAPLAVWVAAESEPSLIKVANIQHLATPVRAQLAEPLSALELAGALHPTPALGGEPWERARDAIRLERLDRGWYAGPVGWMDATEDGELCVAIRCALLAGRTAHCYAGVGVVADSDPEAELAETEVKLQAVLPALTGD